MSKEQPNNPLHGIKLATMLEELYLLEITMEKDETRVLERK